MYAIIETGGRQFWVTPGETILVEKLKAEHGQELTLNALWAVKDAAEGQEPQSSRKATVVAQVLTQTRGPKILVFRKKPKKAYKRMQGHRQALTQLLIKSISFN
ncbi:MAG: 50S ribosomal protein L21 [Elusimicrobia bacterium]|nr:50S ribosomal protein L21 [Elusimicrobiota bacterium]